MCEKEGRAQPREEVETGALPKGHCSATPPTPHQPGGRVKALSGWIFGRGGISVPVHPTDSPLRRPASPIPIPTVTWPRGRVSGHLPPEPSNTSSSSPTPSFRTLAALSREAKTATQNPQPRRKIHISPLALMLVLRHR